MYRAILGLVLTLLPLCAEGVSQAEYRARRAELRKSLDGVLVLFGAEDPTDLHDRFFQEPNFYYLTGWQEPGAALVMTSAEEILFCRRGIRTWRPTTAAPPVRKIKTRRRKPDFRKCWLGRRSKRNFSA